MVTIPEVSPGFAEVADKILPSVSDDQQILHKETRFIIVGNFTTNQDMRSNKISNKKTGLDADSFLVVLQDFCARHDLGIERFFQDSVVIRGSEDDLQNAKSELGLRFSYAFTDSEQLQYMIEQEAKWAMEHGRQASQSIARPILALDA